MTRQLLTIGGIPCILWGAPSDRVFIHVHGKMSRKEYAESFAELAEEAGFQTLSFDLPEHGERTDPAVRCDVWNGMRDLNTIADYAFANWHRVSLYACSLGAWFSLQTYGNRLFDTILFQSPVVDMVWLVTHMMQWSGVTEEQLRQAGEIPTPIDSLRWDYYCYILSHPVTRWHPGTRVLYGALDDLQPMDSILSFAQRFKAAVTVSEHSRHPFMEEADHPIVTEWLRKNLGLL